MTDEGKETTHMFDVKGFYQQYISSGVTMIRIKMVIRTPDHS